MGLCGSNEGKTKNDGKTKTTNDGKTIIKEHLIKNEDEIEGDGTNKKKLLRGTPPQNSNSIEEKYTYKLINSKTQKTFENEINGKTTIEQLLTDLNLRRDGDFIIEFENKMTISQDEKDLKFEEVFMKIFNSKDKTKIIEMNYKYTGLDIPDNMNDVIKEYIDSAMLDLGIAGVDVPQNADALINKAIMTYVRMSFGSPADYDKLKASYDEQKAQLQNATGYTDWGGGA